MTKLSLGLLVGLAGGTLMFACNSDRDGGTSGSGAPTTTAGSADSAAASGTGGDGDAGGAGSGSGSETMAGDAPADQSIVRVESCSDCPASKPCVTFGGSQHLCIPGPATLVEDCSGCSAAQICRSVGNDRYCSDAPAACGGAAPDCDCLADAGFCKECMLCSPSGAALGCFADCDGCPDVCGGEEGTG